MKETKLTDQTTNLFGRKERTGMTGLGGTRTLRVRTHSSDGGPIEPVVTNEIHQLDLATKLSKGKIVTPCVVTGMANNEETVLSKCPLLTLTEGCSKPLVFRNDTASCSEGKGEIRIHSEFLPVAEIVEIMEKKIA